MASSFNRSVLKEQNNDYVENVDDIKPLEQLDIPEALQARLFPHQNEGVSFCIVLAKQPILNPNKYNCYVIFVCMHLG